jgi:hypothetical protein
MSFMTGKKALTWVLVCFVVASFGYVIMTESARKTTAEQSGNVASPIDPAPSVAEGEDQVAPEASQKVIAYYFHGNVRCPTCLKIEAYSQEALEKAFPEQLASGQLEWQAINTDEVWNTHFIEDFSLQFSSLVIASASGAATKEWKNLEKVWNLVGDKEAFLEYVQTETTPFLEGS